MSLRWKIAQWFESQWWKFYLGYKDKEGYLTWKKNYWNNILVNLSNELKIEPSKAIIDLGCGPAGVFIALPENKITAVDPLIDEYEDGVPFFKKSAYPNVAFVKSTMEEFHPQEKFDLVFCMNAINHVHDIEKGFDKLKELCADSGTIIISVDAHNFSFLKYLFRFIPGDVLHPHQFDLIEYKSFLQKRGMRISKTEPLKKEFFFNHYLLVATR